MVFVFGTQLDIEVPMPEYTNINANHFAYASIISKESVSVFCQIEKVSVTKSIFLELKLEVFF